MKTQTQETPAAHRSKGSATIHDVAREARVSIATVSRVLNGTGTVRPATLAKVNAALERLKFVPHGGARSLVMRATRTIGVLLPDMHGEFFSEVIRGIDQVARHRGFSLLVTSTHGDSHSAEAMLRTLYGKVDGLVVLSSDPEMFRAVSGLVLRTPVVFLNRVQGPKAERFDSVCVDNQGGALTMTRYLMGLGHRRIAFVKGPEGNEDAAARLQGYREAVEVQEGAEPLELHGDFSEEGGFRAACRALRMEPAPTAIFAANDTMAIGVYRALRERGIRIPGDMSVAGFDDVPFVSYLEPPLTSIHAPISELGGRAARRLLDRIESEDELTPQQQSLEVLLVARSSVGPAGGAPSRTASPSEAMPLPTATLQPNPTPTSTQRRKTK
jgi:LacI family transcriptional regulator